MYNIMCCVILDVTGVAYLQSAVVGGMFWCFLFVSGCVEENRQSVCAWMGELVPCFMSEALTLVMCIISI